MRLAKIVLLVSLLSTGLVASAATAFLDVPEDHMFVDDIGWLSDEGITKGCNPPANDRFCPDDPVTRGQMAAFLERALGLTEVDPDLSFVDVAAGFHGREASGPERSERKRHSN